eukprot:SM000207S06202  [mRNA]  locus=s207:116463:117413:- [translate_table: standard]
MLAAAEGGARQPRRGPVDGGRGRSALLQLQRSGRPSLDTTVGTWIELLVALVGLCIILTFCGTAAAAERASGGISVRDIDRVALAHDYCWGDDEVQDMIDFFDGTGSGKTSPRTAFAVPRCLHIYKQKPSDVIDLPDIAKWAKFRDSLFRVKTLTSTALWQT